MCISNIFCKPGESDDWLQFKGWEDENKSREDAGNVIAERNKEKTNNISPEQISIKKDSD